MYAQVVKSKGNKSRAVAQTKSNVKQGAGIVDNRPEAIVQSKLIDTINSGTNILQLRSSKIVEGSAQKHYNDGWGARYGIQNDDTLKAKVPKSVRGDGTIDLGIYESKRWVYKGDTYRNGKRCSIAYKDYTEGRKKYKKTYTSIYHCGPSGPNIQQKL